MRSSFLGFWSPVSCSRGLRPIASAGDAKDDAIKNDRKQIEGTWKVVTIEVNGNKAPAEDARKLTVVNGSDGTWSLLSEGKPISKGTSTIDPTKKPKTIDFTQTEGDGKGNHYLGIYELSKNLERCALPHRRRNGPPSFLLCPAASIFSLPSSGTWPNREPGIPGPPWRRIAGRMLPFLCRTIH